MKVSYTHRAVLRAAIKGHVVKTRELKASKSRLKASKYEWKEYVLNVLQEHRQTFRHEGRMLHLAYNFAKGTPYEKVERYRGAANEATVKAISHLVRCAENPVREWLGLEILWPPKTARGVMRAMRAAPPGMARGPSTSAR